MSFNLRGFTIVASLIFASCSGHLTKISQANAAGAPPVTTDEMQPIIPTQLINFKTDGTLKNTSATSNCSTTEDDKKNALAKLGNTRIYAYNYYRDQGTGKLTYLSAAAKITKGTEIVQIFDYLKYSGESIGGKAAILGIGYRIHINYTASGKDIDLGGLFNVSANYTEGKISGTMNIDVIGIAGEPIDAALPGAPLTITDENILSLFNDMSRIKAAIYNTSVQICPQITAIKSPDAEVKLFE
ncbi:hypothetical protein [Curvivirga aplysinae]|uniref:hypothetical protein n=1 Tax=Curvivirga aplysinae TaxID=2529852 RepID=UPI0012BCF70B|nr:hypothetical protein [Curvivirga aplysinae]MTI09743.1 hypothetical protein [Curvivirga aplysinae]